MEGGIVKTSEMDPGTILKFLYKGSEFDGTLISSDSESFLIKLNSGYNLTVPKESIEINESRHPASAEESVPVGGKRFGGQKITLIGSGGTIASRVDYSTGAVKPVHGAEFLEGNIPNFEKFDIDVTVLPPVFSEDMTVKNWKKIAKSVFHGLEQSKGVVVMHGTDTMAYTASALAFMFQRQSGPIILTGSQRSSDRPSSDAFLNIEASLEFAATDFGEVGIAMHKSISDTTVGLLRGVRTRKMHSSRRDAFKPIGLPEIASYSNKKIDYNSPYTKKSESNIFSEKLEPRVGLVYFSPVLEVSDFETMASNKKAVILSGTGLGHVSNRFASIIHRLTRADVKFYMTTQCIYGSVNMNVYSTGRNLLSAGVVPLRNMLSEVALVKSMYVLANYEYDDVDRAMQENLRGEIIDREIPFYVEGTS